MRIGQWKLFKISRNSIKLLLLSIFFCYGVHLVIYYTNICKNYETTEKEESHGGVHISQEHHEDIHINHINKPQDKLENIDKVDETVGIHIVEEHHHVWPVWKRHKPSAVVHIDAHPDTGFNGEDPPNANDVFIYQGAREKWLKTLIWIWPTWDAAGPRHVETAEPVTNYTGYWGIWKALGLGGLWTSTMGFCVCEQDKDKECGNMEEDVIQNKDCQKIEGTDFEVIIVSTNFVLENPGWLKKTLKGQSFILDFDLDYAAALNNPISQSLELSLQTVSSLIDPIFKTSMKTECKFHQKMMNEMANMGNCSKSSKTELEQIICLDKHPERVRKKVIESGFCIKDDMMQVCCSQGSDDVSQNWKDHFNESLSDLGRLVSLVIKENGLDPVAVTVCRSVRDGYTPAALAPLIEQTLIKALQSQGEKPVFYDQQLWCGEKGPELANINRP